MSGVDPNQVLTEIVAPTLDLLGLDHAPAQRAAIVELIMGTGLQETGFRYVAQLDRGPARGPFQMERATYDDIWKNFLPTRAPLASVLRSLRAGAIDTFGQLAGNWYYAVAMTRVFYLRVAAPLPATGDLDAQATYYKAHYNTAAGAATVEEYLANYLRAFPTESRHE